MIQFCVAFFGFVAIFLTQVESEKLKRYAPVFGLISQPFFLFSTLEAEQWGMFLLSVAYTFAWLFGIYNVWIKPHRILANTKNPA